MTIGQICTKKVVVLSKDEPLMRAAKLMKEAGIGNVLIIEGEDDTRVPIGIVTDRDLVVEVLDQNKDIDSLTVADVMNDDLITIQEDMETLACLEMMQKERIRRACRG